LNEKYRSDELANPNALVQAFAGNLADTLLGTLDLPEFMPTAGGQNMEWTARRTRLKIGSEFVPVYRLETTLLGRHLRGCEHPRRNFAHPVARQRHRDY
jgi:hypothetical protein